MQYQVKKRGRWRNGVTIAGLILLSSVSTVALGRHGGDGDAGDSVSAAQDRIDRSEVRDTVRVRDTPDREVRATDAERREIKVREQAIKDAADAEVRQIKDQADQAVKDVRTAEEANKQQLKDAEDAAKDAADQQQDAAKDAEDAAKDAEDAAKEAAKEAEDAAKDAEDAAEDAAKAAEEAAEEAAEASGEDRAYDDSSNSASMRDLATPENPEFDAKGFPARRGEIVGLDMRADALTAARAQGFKVIGETALGSLDSVVTRLSVPTGMDNATAIATMRQIDAKGIYDVSHYYGLNFSTAGNAGGGKAIKPMAFHKGGLWIGMIDTAVASHPLLRGATIEMRDFTVQSGLRPTGHGTAVASILAGQGASRIEVANIFQSNGGKPFTSADAIVKALEWMVERGVPVINMSLAGPRNIILDRLVARATARGHVIVAAAGNGGPGAAPAYPAAVPNVVAVTAVDEANRIYRYANQGRYIRVASHGVAIPAAAANGGLSSFSGTSFASPIVAARIARCMKRSAAADAGKTCVTSLERSAQDLGAPGRDPVYGFGLVD